MKFKVKVVLAVLISVLPSFIKIFIYRNFYRAKIGKNVRVGFGAVLCFSEMSLADHVRIGGLTVILVSKLNLEKKARVGSFTRIICYAVLLGCSAKIASWVSILADHRDSQTTFEAGAESWIFDYCYINPTCPITLGRNVGVGGGSYLFTHGFWLSKLDGYPVGFGSIDIADDVWLPWGCFIMPGVSIGSGVVLGARSLVTKSIPAGVLAAGSPAKVVREAAAVSLTILEKNEVLINLTMEFAKFIAKSVLFEEKDHWIFCKIDDELVFVLATQETPFSFPDAQSKELCLVHMKYFEAEQQHPRTYSLTSYQCCQSDLIGDVQLKWFKYMRKIGLRYYPIDDILVED